MDTRSTGDRSYTAKKVRKPRFSIMALALTIRFEMWGISVYLKHYEAF